jgi:hypothetical protein
MTEITAFLEGTGKGEPGPDNKEVEIPVPRTPMEGERIYFDNHEYVIRDIIHNLDNRTMEVYARLVASEMVVEDPIRRWAY